MAPRSFADFDSLRGLVGEELGCSDWMSISQAGIDSFASATEDFNFVHVDPVRAVAAGMGGTIAHGLLTLSLGPRFNYEIVEFGEALGLELNYGYDRVRFPAPLPSGSRLRMRLALVDLASDPNGTTLRLRQTFEREGGERPVCVAEFLLRFVGGREGDQEVV